MTILPRGIPKAPRLTREGACADSGSRRRPLLVLVPNLWLGTPVAKLRFAAPYPTLAASISREAELPDRRPQAELGDEGRTPPAELPETIRAPAREARRAFPRPHGAGHAFGGWPWGAD